jgi:hypothetical protein
VRISIAARGTPCCAESSWSPWMQKTGARQYSRGRFHLLLPAVRVTTQAQVSEGGGQLRSYPRSLRHRTCSKTAALSIPRHERMRAQWHDHNTASGALSTSVGVDGYTIRF